MSKSRKSLREQHKRESLTERMCMGCKHRGIYGQLYCSHGEDENYQAKNKDLNCKDYNKMSIFQRISKIICEDRSE